MASAATEIFHPPGRVNTETIRLIIARLVVRYGSGSWNAKYREVEEETLVKDWFHALAHFSLRDIDYALENLPPDYLPNASQFRLICQRAPAPPGPPALDAPRPDPARLRAAFERMGKIAATRGPQAWIADLEARLRAGETLPIAHRAMLDRAQAALAHRGPDVPLTTEDARRTAELKAAAAARYAAYARGHA